MLEPLVPGAQDGELVADALDAELAQVLAAQVRQRRAVDVVLREIVAILCLRVGQGVGSMGIGRGNADICVQGRPGSEIVGADVPTFRNARASN
eukprot:5929345-Pleurochrysis_carterae.AAC.3